MFSRVRLYLALLLLAATGPAHAAGPGAFRPIPRDTLETATTERNRRLYDSIQTKSSRRAVPRMLYRMLFTRSDRDTTMNGQATDESRALEPYAGKRIGTIRIDRAPIFPPDGNWLERTADKIHMLTRERVIRRDLLFRPGDRLDPQLVVRNKQLLRSRAYIADVDIAVSEDPLDSTRVDLVIRTRDSWTITLDGSWRSEGRTMVGIYDANILGTGNELKIKTNFDRHDFSYGGNLFEYEIPNLLGTFYKAELSAGRDFYNSELRLDVRKEFLRPTDYEAGIAYEKVKTRRYLLEQDMRVPVKAQRIDAWGGLSRYLVPIRSSLYLTARYNYTRFPLRPEVSASCNPAFHDRDALLAGIGLYRERFYSANMVYGYGTKEYIASGYKAEVVSGYSWGEFNDEMYLGITTRAGGFGRIGYLIGNFTLGSFIDLESGKWSHSGVDVDLGWFSNLFSLRSSRIRQFVRLRYTQGWNRDRGADESIRFTKVNGLHALDERTIGINRMTLNTETVFFTPYQPLGFRIALFGFADFGSIGYSSNIFRNSFYSTIGLGIRIKNERLIFSAIQLRLGLAFGKGGLVGCDYFRLSSASQLESHRYRPTRPEIVGFE